MGLMMGIWGMKRLKEIPFSLFFRFPDYRLSYEESL